MGIDIYLFAEKQVGNGWQAIPNPTPEQWEGRLRPTEAIDIGRPYDLSTGLTIKVNF